MGKLILVLLTAMSANAYAHFSCEGEIGNAFVEDNKTELLQLAAQTSSTLSAEGRMFLAVAALRSGFSIAELNRLESEVPYALGQSINHLLDGEERAVIATAAADLNQTVHAVLARIDETPATIPTKLRILVGIASLRDGTDVRALGAAAQSVYDNR